VISTLVFAAAGRAVEAFHDAAVAHGAEVLHAPKEWPEDHAGYYGAFVRDPTTITSRQRATAEESTCRLGNLVVLSQ
jgi:hypothetical protein